ncbi:LIM and calponin homology domains-containing protein 1 [Hoplias malabaricus]|uniref:LIM and calponin homology domains-containing protein 1 n=1 Tax=Hoplias malabaricus TaxID=27720 RepID=UPI003461CE8F
MSSSKTLQSGYQGIRDPNKRRTGLLTDNSWIRRDTEEEVSVDPPTITPSKPPVPAKNLALSPASKSFTDRVFSGANTNEKVYTPVRKVVDNKSLVLNDPHTDINFSDNSFTLSPVPNVPSSPVQTTTISERTQVSSVIKTEQTTNSYESNNITSPKQVTIITKTATVPRLAARKFTAPRETLDISDDILSPRLSTTLHTNPVSYSSLRSTNTTRSTLFESPSSQTLSSLPVNSSPGPKLSKRIVGKRDLCSFCGKSIVEGERMILDDLQIYSHTTCFKCEQCYGSLGFLEAGTTLWVHGDKVKCDNCYKKTKDQWFR